MTLNAARKNSIRSASSYNTVLRPDDKSVAPLCLQRTGVVFRPLQVLLQSGHPDAIADLFVGNLSERSWTFTCKNRTLKVYRSETSFTVLHVVCSALIRRIYKQENYQQRSSRMGRELCAISIMK